MTKYTVLPRDDGTDFQQSWMVVGGGQRTPHTTKQAARNAARRRANIGDTIEVRRTDGTVQERFEVRKASRSGAGREDTVGLFKNFDFGLD